MHAGVVRLRPVSDDYRHGLHYSPFAYLLIGGILKNMDATLEESATILKASRATIIRRVTIPIVMPAILSTFLLIFSSGFSSYTVPVFLGSAVKCYTLSTKMRALIQAGYQGRATSSRLSPSCWAA